jgi:hypothetical protein
VSSTLARASPLNFSVYFRLDLKASGPRRSVVRWNGQRKNTCSLVDGWLSAAERSLHTGEVVGSIRAHQRNQIVSLFSCKARPCFAHEIP